LVEYLGEERITKVTISGGKKYMDKQYFENKLTWPDTSLPAYVIGNGPSRKDFDLSSVMGLTYGCNALYRDFVPNYLITIDSPITDEVVESGYAKDRYGIKHVYSPCKEVMKYPDQLHLIPNHITGHNAGATALRIALLHGHTEVIMVGFDADPTMKTIPNIYAGTPCYADEGAEAHSIKWAAQFTAVANEYPTAKITKY